MEELYVKTVTIEEKLPEDSYLHRIPAIRQLEEMPLEFNKRVTFLIGENGTGKSTLIEAIAIACGFNPEGGSKSFTFSTSDSHSGLWKHISVSRNAYPRDGFFLRAESFYNVATSIDEMDRSGFGPRLIDAYGGISLHEQSHGESFLALVKNRFRGHGLYILDEPEAALSSNRLMQLLVKMHDLEKDSQFLIATHSPILMSYPGAQILELDEEGMHEVDFRDTENYRITKAFLERPEVMYHHLFEEDEM
jgi:predicted ATPase